jgi:glutamine amidotransferase
MFRLLGIVADRPTTLRDCLGDAPRSLAWLFDEHPDGCGVALCSAEESWHLRKSAGRPRLDRRLSEVASSEAAEILLAHIRQRTVGRVCLANTHPFRHDRWVFAHTGTIEDLDFLQRRTSARRARQVGGDTDSERLFAYLLSCLDAGQATGIHPTEHADTAIGFAVREMREHTPAGQYTFLLSDGISLYVYRRGVPLFLLQRRVGQGASPSSSSVVVVASEPISDEAWQPVEELALLRVDRLPVPQLRVLIHGLQAEPPSPSAPELPFTD